MEDEFSLEQVRVKLAEIVTENPHKVTEQFASSPRCRYTHPDTGEPSCIIGVLLDRLGVERRTIRLLDADPLDTAVSSNRNPFWKRFTSNARLYMGQVQMEQDSGLTWRTAVKNIEEKWGLS